DDAAIADRLRRFRNHGIDTDHRRRAKTGAWHYEMIELGYNYRLSDIHCTLALSQLGKLRTGIQRRKAIARRYDAAFAALPGIRPLAVRAGIEHAYHLYVVRVAENRDVMFAALRDAGIGVAVHYPPVHLHPFYRERFGTQVGSCPVAEAACQDVLSLPMYPGLTDAEVDHVIASVGNCIDGLTRHSKKLSQFTPCRACE